jgi:uroporphyrin-III C-methyltransferase / precorrin-2 dehydrogenase / sirohydrochlorin ferrochelatase
MDYLPIFLNLRGRRCLLVGGGKAAAAKAAMLRRAGAEVAVVARRLCPELAAAIRRGEMMHPAEHFTETLLDGAVLVMVADATPAVSAAVSRAVEARALPVNVMDEPALCSFIVPAIVDRSPVVVAIASGGTAPMLASLLRQWLDRVLPARLGALAALAGCFRPLVKRRLCTPTARRRFWHRVFTGNPASLALSGNDEAACRALLDALADAAPPVDGPAKAA